MPGRYEIVDEPAEPLEVVEDEVYHPDLTVRDSENGSSFRRSIEPMFGGPITLKTIFYDPRWSPNTRKCCLGIVVVVSLVCFILMIALFVGLGTVLSYINENERLKQTGLYMIPDLEQFDIDTFFYDPDSKYSTMYKRYISQLDDYLATYANLSGDYKTCDIDEQRGKSKLCRFELNWLGANCTTRNRYGYDVGTPCLLFSLRNVKTWNPNVTSSFLDDSVIRSSTNKDQQLDEYHVPLTCSAYSALHNQEVQADDLFRYYPSSGFNISFLTTNSAADVSQLPPLVFVQLINPQRFDQLVIKCQIWASNIEQLKGVRQIEFQFGDPEENQGAILDGP